PLMHNQTFQHLGMNALYLPFRVPRGDLGEFLKQFDRLPVHGYSVTIPHKEGAMAAAQHLDPAARMTAAGNTLWRGKGGLTAYNNDLQAALESLMSNLPHTPETGPPTLHGRTVLLLGAGGVARAVAYAMHREGALVTIANRTPEKALKLKEDVGCRVIDWEARHSVICDILINCTSVGMHPNVDESPVHPSYLKPGLVVFDTVYTPETTLLVKEARSRGCHVLTGVDMFLRQAALQFKLFTGREPPMEFMRTVIKRALSPVALREEA